jgi:hypothetical protein
VLADERKDSHVARDGDLFVGSERRKEVSKIKVGREKENNRKQRRTSPTTFKSLATLSIVPFLISP